MTTVRRRAAPRGRAPIKITRVIREARAGSMLAKLRELEAKLADDDSPEMEHHVAQELAAHLSKIEHPKPATKAARHEPAARVVGTSIATSANQAHALRGALGLRSDPDAAQKSAQEITARRQTKAEAAQQGSPGRAVDVPDQAKPQVLHRPLPSVQEFTATGQRLPEPTRDAVVYTAITELFVAANRQPITLGAAELGRATGLTAEQVNQSIVSLERRGLIQRQPGRASTVALWSIAAV